MKPDKTMLLRVLVGSRAHGISNEDSDYDYRGVFVYPTAKVMSLFYKYKWSDWIEGDEDNTAYEVRHFLEMAAKCNPSILEVFKAPVMHITDEGREIRKLFRDVVDDRLMKNAFFGYGYNQQKKMLDNKDSRWHKFGTAYIRVLHQLYEWFLYRELPVKFTDDTCYNMTNMSIRDTLIKIRQKEFSPGEIIDISRKYKEAIDILYQKLETDGRLIRQTPVGIDRINKVLYEIRLNH